MERDDVVDAVITVPPHQDAGDPNWSARGDAAGYFPSAESAREYARGIASSPYHRDRQRTLARLLGSARLAGLPATVRVLDYGIGDGGVLKSLGLQASSIVGVDVSGSMIELARESFADLGFTGLAGSVEALAAIHSSSIDIALCINTLGYLTTQEQDAFFSEMTRIVAPGGFLIIMTGNELFDLFALNSGTAEFFRNRLDVADAAELLTEGMSAQFQNAARANPLSFGLVLSGYGFREAERAFASWHNLPPILLTRRTGMPLHEARDLARDYDFDCATLPPDQVWRAYFQCSIFASLLQRDHVGQRGMTEPERRSR